MCWLTRESPANTTKYKPNHKKKLKNDPHQKESNAIPYCNRCNPCRASRAEAVDDSDRKMSSYVHPSSLAEDPIDVE
jgi:hypothetical protein